VNENGGGLIEERVRLVDGRLGLVRRQQEGGEERDGEQASAHQNVAPNASAISGAICARASSGTVAPMPSPPPAGSLAARLGALDQAGPARPLERDHVLGEARRSREAVAPARRRAARSEVRFMTKRKKGVRHVSCVPMTRTWDRPSRSASRIRSAPSCQTAASAHAPAYDSPGRCCSVPAR
jgi:hypothetical protein